MLIKDGKISKVGKNLSDPTAIVIDGTGKHLTAGIIDEHSHIGAASINDVASNSGMVRIGDNLDAEAINIYRALAGGVVAVQVLHGSANPIGGQSALIKLRWGESPENLKIAGADGFIKFALGENVKRTSNPSSIRFPQTRMGVEQVYVDAFTSAKEYEKKTLAPLIQEVDALRREVGNLSQRQMALAQQQPQAAAAEARKLISTKYEEIEEDTFRRWTEQFDPDTKIKILDSSILNKRDAKGNIIAKVTVEYTIPSILGSPFVSKSQTHLILDEKEKRWKIDFMAETKDEESFKKEG